MKKDFKTRFAAFIETLFEELDQEAIQRNVDALRAEYPDATKEQLAHRLATRAAWRTAAVGAAAGATGGGVAVLAMAPDIFNLVREQSRLVLGIAFLYGRTPGLQERFREVMAVLAVAAGASIAREGVEYLVSRGLEEIGSRKIARKLAGRYLVRRLPEIAPVVGSIVGGALNLAAVRAVEKAAVKYYGPKGEEDEAPETGA